MISLTGASLGSRPWATDRIVISRSVTVPINLSFSQTGRNPMLSSRIFSAAFEMGRVGSADSTILVMICWIFMAQLPRELSEFMCKQGSTSYEVATALNAPLDFDSLCQDRR